MNRKPYLSIFAFALVCLAMGLLTSCTIGSKSGGGGGGNTPAAIAATSGSGQSIAVSGTYTALSATVTNSAGAGVSGVSVVFAVVAGSSGATASFATGGATDTETTNSSGVATTSQVLTAGTVAGGFTVTATASGASIPPATFTETNTALAAATLTATSGAGQSATIGAAFTNPLVATVTDANSNPVQGVSVTFTAPASGASGTFASSGTATETDTTDVNGNATSSVLTANSTTGGPYNVVASSTGLTSVNFAETNTSGVAVIGNGNYAFTLSGLDTDDYSLYFVSGVFTVSGGAITGGEQDYVDYSNYSNNSTTGGADLINPTGSTITATADGNLQIVLTTCSGSTCTSTDGVVGVNGVETINATLRPTNANQAVLVEFDGSGAATGEMRLQDPTAAAATPSLGYAFQVSGFDASEDILNIGGIINVDGAGTISGSGSIFDANDDSSGTALQAETLQANTGTVSAPDGFGRVVFSITPTDTTDFQQISWVGYIVDSTRVYLVETADSYVGTTGGIAFSQGASTGTFSSSSISSSTYGTAMTGFDGNGPLQVVGALTFNSSGTVSGFIDFNDLSGSEPVSPDPITAPAYTVDSTGRVTITGATDGVVETINLQLYLNGNGQVVAVTMDTGDNLGSTLGGQLSGPFSNANFTGNYAMAAWGWDGSETGEFSAVGTSTATGTGDTFSGFADLNYFNSTTTTVPAADATVSGSYTLSANSGILTPSSITGLDVDSGFTNTDAFNFYQVDSIGTTVVIETDSNQLTLGIFQP
jgi:hypothetical protein